MCTIVALTVCMFQRSVFFNITEELGGILWLYFYIVTELAATRVIKLGDCECLTGLMYPRHFPEFIVPLMASML